MSAPLRFGVFITPFHPVGQSPTVALEYDMERVVALDRLGFDEAWFGEHHSGGYELIACPEIFIAAAAERTKHIRLGTGVVSLPYHHPLMVADRWVLLDHLTRGRVMFGTGPVRGFAVTLVIGLFANVFTAVYVSKAIFDWELSRSKQVTALSI